MLTATANVLLALLLAFPVLTGCGRSLALASSGPRASAASRVTFAVMSDPHVFEPSLGTSGAAFTAYLATDRKMVAQSAAVFEAAATTVCGSDASFVVICGDLTKDGELLSHLRVAQVLARYRAAGKAVYVIPGNHDIDNPEAVRYTGATTQRVDSVSAATFADVYAQDGYAAAILRDPHSLSYVAQPAPGLWLLAIDSVTYAQDLLARGPSNAAESALYEQLLPGGGAVSQATLAWIRRVLAEGKRRGVRVVAFTHHGICEHFGGESLLFSRWLLTGRDEMARVLTQGGVNLVFTGHFHAQDVTRSQAGLTRLPLWDVETGSLITPPCAYRMVTFSADRRKVSVTSPTVSTPGTRAAQADPDAFLAPTAQHYVRLLRVRPSDGALLAPVLAQAFARHFAGDEGGPATSVREMADPRLGSLWSKAAWSALKRVLVRGLRTDTNTPDNALTIQLPD